MRVEQTIDVGGLTVTLRELTVGDVRAWLKSLESLSPQGRGQGEGESLDLVGVALIDGHDLADLAVLTDLTPEQIDTLTPSQIRTVFDAARKVNADFFTLRATLADIGRAALATPAAS